MPDAESHVRDEEDTEGNEEEEELTPPLRVMPIPRSLREEAITYYLQIREA